MNNRTKGYIVLVLLTVYATCSFLYTAPQRYTSDTARMMSAYVLTPWLKQNWQLFGPDVPSENYEMVIRVDGFDDINCIQSVIDKGTRWKPHIGKTARALYNWCLFVEGEVHHGKSHFYRSGLVKIARGMLKYFSTGVSDFVVIVRKGDKIIYESDVQKN